MRIDVHAHYYPEKYIGCVSRLRGETNYRIRAPGAAVTLEQHVDLLDKAGIRVQILSVGAQQPSLSTPRKRSARPSWAMTYTPKSALSMAAISPLSPRCRCRTSMRPSPSWSALLTILGWPASILVVRRPPVEGFQLCHFGIVHSCTTFVLEFFGCSLPVGARRSPQSHH